MDKRRAAIGMVFAGAALIAIGVLVRDWWSGELYRGSSLSIGLTSMKVCVNGQCEPMSLSQLVGDENGAWTLVGAMLLYGGLATAAVLLLIGGLELRGKRVHAPIAPTTVGFLLSGAVLLLGFLFVMLKPKGLNGSGLQAGLSFFILSAGAIGGLLGSILIAKAHAAVDDAEWLMAARQQVEAERVQRPPTDGDPW